MVDILSRLSKYIERLKESEVPVIFITHNIYHVYQVADKFTVLDRGVKVGEFFKKDVKPEDIIEVIRLGKTTERLERNRICG